MGSFTVRKLDHAGREVLSYQARVLQRDRSSVVLHTSWTSEPQDLGFVVLEPGDLWTETFFADRWYNIFEIRASDGQLKGWYCNVTRPAEIGADEVVAEDLALDLWVGPDGETRVLDEEEFTALSLSPAERRAARGALTELQRAVAEGAVPFGGAGSIGEQWRTDGGSEYATAGRGGGKAAARTGANPSDC